MLALLKKQNLKSGSGCPDPYGQSRKEGTVGDLEEAIDAEGGGWNPRDVESTPKASGFEHMNRTCVQILKTLVLGLVPEEDPAAIHPQEDEPQDGQDRAPFVHRRIV
jgi:hypothetical protein